jgi:hypothetical protein
LAATSRRAADWIGPFTIAKLYQVQPGVTSSAISHIVSIASVSILVAYLA